MILRIYFHRRTERRPIEFDVVLQPSNKDPKYALDFARRTVDAVTGALREAGADFAPAGKALRHCANIEYRLRIYKRTNEMYWDDPVVNCDPDELVATCNAAIVIRNALEVKEPA